MSHKQKQRARKRELKKVEKEVKKNEPKPKRVKKEAKVEDEDSEEVRLLRKLYLLIRKLCLWNLSTDKVVKLVKSGDLRVLDV